MKTSIVIFCWIIISPSLCLNVTVFASNGNASALTEEFTSKQDDTPYVRHSESKRFRSMFSADRYNSIPMLGVDMKYCQRPANCQPLNYTTCMGSKLPYHHTTLDLTDLKSQAMVQERLQVYQYLRYLPKCWAVIQQFLCALYMPKCENGNVDLPSREMCRVTLGPCKILYNTSIFPEFMNCEDERLFPSLCKNDIHEVKFNTTGFCMEPLVHIDQQERSYLGIDGCGLQCKDAYYTDDEHQQIQKLMIYCITICIFLNLFAVVTFILDWKTANKYPALAIFYINLCFLISYCGWLVQFLGSETREDIVCRKDGTLRKHEPSANENLSCVAVFVTIYYFLMAGMVWFVVFSYAWLMSSLQALGKIQERVDKKRAYFHLIAWSLPLILTITTMALGEIDGDYIAGICFVGFINVSARIGLLLVPLALMISIGGYIVAKGLLLLIKVKIKSRTLISEHSSRKIRSNIVRMGVFSMFLTIFSIITFLYHIYVMSNSKTWNESLQNFILCRLTSLNLDFSHCKHEARPSVAMLQLQLLAVFGSGIAVASWVWCTATFRAWSRYIRRKFHCQLEEQMKFQKHKIIAQAFEKRKKFNEGRKISIECQHHTDPVGLHFDLNSAASNELSTTWAANLPRFVNRRGAVPNEMVTYSISSNSEMSYSLQRISIESRRNSGESQLSVQISEVTAKINSRMQRRLRCKRGSREYRHKTRRSKVNHHRKRNSVASLDSQFEARLLNLINDMPNSKNLPSNLNKRRTANAGLDEQNLKLFASKARLTLPHDSDGSESDDENLSVEISKSKFNVVVNSPLNNSNLDLSDQLIMKSLRQDLCIDQLNTSVESVPSADKQRKRQQKQVYYVPTDSDSSTSDDGSSCPELKQLLQSSYNSGASVVTQNRASKQSKTSFDVAVQADAEDITTQMSALGKDRSNCAGDKTVDENYSNNEHKKVITT